MSQPYAASVTMGHMEARGLWKLFVAAAMRWPARRISHSHLFVLFRAGTFARGLSHPYWLPCCRVLGGHRPCSLHLSQPCVAVARREC